MAIATFVTTAFAYLEYICRNDIIFNNNYTMIILQSHVVTRRT